MLNHNLVLILLSFIFLQGTWPVRYRGKFTVSASFSRHVKMILCNYATTFHVNPSPVISPSVWHCRMNHRAGKVRQASTTCLHPLLNLVSDSFSQLMDWKVMIFLQVFWFSGRSCCCKARLQGHHAGRKSWLTSSGACWGRAWRASWVTECCF